MAKAGNIFLATYDEQYNADKEWMQQYGCVQVTEEPSLNKYNVKLTRGPHCNPTKKQN